MKTYDEIADEQFADRMTAPMDLESVDSMTPERALESARLRRSLGLPLYTGQAELLNVADDRRQDR